MLRWHSSMKDDVEKFGWDRLVVSDRKRLAQRGQILDELRLFLASGIELGLAPEHRVEALDGRDYDFGRGADCVPFEMLNLVEIGKLAMVVGSAVTLEFLLCLVAEIRSIDQKEHPARASKLD